jgi:hypothetical protein
MADEAKVYRADIEPPPPRIAALPVARGFPVPWFVTWIDGQPEFRVADGEKLVRAVKDKLCWVCGEPLGRFLSFVLGPLGAVNRVNSEPPSHLECARYAAKNCPFLRNPAAHRREKGMPEESRAPTGLIPYNPTVACVWTTRGCRAVLQPDGGILFDVGEPTQAVEFYREGRAATREEIDESLRTGLPFLERMCDESGPAHALENRLELRKCVERLEALLPPYADPVAS